MDLDNLVGWCNSPSVADCEMSTFQSTMPLGFGDLNFEEAWLAAEPSGEPSGPPQIANDMNGCSREEEVNDSPQNQVLDVPISSLIGLTLDDKMSKVLSLLKESLQGVTLAQVWSPFQVADQLMLSTYDQPFFLNEQLSGYRYVSRKYVFSTDMEYSCRLGLPGRVFTSGVSEWTSNLMFYKKEEYLRADHVIDHQVRGSIAVPIFDGNDMSCVTVLEIVTKAEKQNFDMEMESVCRALEAVTLRTNTPSPRMVQHPHLSDNRKLVLAEITDALRGACRAHNLPLALTWIPCSSSPHSKRKDILCLENTACYVNAEELHELVEIFSQRYIKEGQGAAGSAYKVSHPFVFPDVKNWDISCYPFVHHARKFGLCGAAAIGLRSFYTGNDDYVIEYFLPVNLKDSSEQNNFLYSLMGTIQSLFKSLRLVVGEEELVGREVESQTGTSSSSKQDFPGGQGQAEKRKGKSVAKNVTFNEIQKYFAGTQKDAADGLGVCTTTVKKICKMHNISRWPSRKIQKANSSLKKLKTVLESVEGVEGGLKLDPTTGEFQPTFSTRIE